MSNVTPMAGYKNQRTPEREAHLRRLALQLVVQLPGDTKDALDCLDMAKIAVRSFLTDLGPLGERFCHRCKLASNFGVNHGPDGIPVDIIGSDPGKLTQPHCGMYGD